MHRTKIAYYLLLKEFDAKFFSLAQDDSFREGRVRQTAPQPWL